MGLLRIRSAQALPERRLRLTLTDGSVVERDVGRLLTGPIFEELQRQFEKFAEVRVEGGTVCWPNGADLCPDVLIWGGISPEAEDARPPRALVLDRRTLE
jgi:hypothetical protein